MDLTHDLLVQGVNLITTGHDGKLAGMACAWASQVGVRHLMVCIGPQSETRRLIEASRVFAVHVLGAEQMEMARVFGQGSSGSIDKFADYTWHTGRTGAPLLVGCRRRYECQLERSVELPAEYLGLVGRVVAAERTGKPFEPLIYHEEDY